MKNKPPVFRNVARNPLDNADQLKTDGWHVHEVRGGERQGDAGSIDPQSIVAPGPVNSASPRFSLASGNFTQDWSNAGLITTSDDWSNVPAIVGYRGDNVTSTVGVDLRTLTANDAAPTVDVNANQTDPVVFNTGGVTEFDLANDTIALAGSATADAPYIVIYLDSTGRESVRFQCNLRDLDSSADDAAQQVNIQYRTTPGGAWTNAPGGYFADVTTAGSATQVTAVDITLPADAANSATLEIRIMSVNAAGNDEWVGIDDIVVSSAAIGPTLPTLSINDVSAVEGDSGTTTFTFSVTLNAPAGAGGVTFDIATANGTATTAGGDYVSNSLTGQTIPMGSTGPYLFSVTVNSDTVVEANETFFVNITNVTGATVADGQGQGTITNDDVPPPVPGDFSISDVSHVEGNSGNTLYTFTVTRSGGSDGAVTVDWSTNASGAAGFADATDFDPSQVFSGTLTFANGVTTQTITLEVVGDHVVEGDETFTINLANATGGAGITDASGTGTITNDDNAGSLSIGDVSLAEGDSGTTAFTFTVTRSGGSSGTVTVDYATVDNTATAGSDYAATSGTLTFLDGEISKTITVLVNGDTVFEPNENFNVNLTNATGGATITGGGQGFGFIFNDDPAPAGTLSINDFSFVEGDSGPTTFTFTVSRAGGTAGAVTADYLITAPGGAGNADSADFVPGAVFSGQVSFADGETSRTITIDVQGDTVFEANEVFNVSLSNPTGGATISDDTGIGTITNDDAAPNPGSVSVADVSIVEGNAGTSILTFTLTRTGGAAAFDVNYATSNGGDPTHAAATAVSDYLAASGTVSFANGQNTATVSVTINGDVTPELSEEFTLTLSGATNGATLSDATAIGTITTDDAAPASTLIFSESFNTFTAGGFAPNPTAGQIDSDIWRVVGLSDIANPAYGFTATTGDFARGTITTNDPTTAGVYSVSGAGALIVQPSAAELEAGGFIEARITNSSGSTATGFDVAFDWDYRNSGDRASTLQFSYSTDGTNFTAVPAGAFITPATLAAGAVFTLQHETLSLSGLSVANGDFIYLRWTHVSSAGSGSRDEVGIDNVSVSTTGGATGPLVSVSDVSVNEAAGTMTFTVTRANVAAGAFTVDYATADGTALAGSDYTATSGTLSFADNQTTATVTVAINNDGTPELNETLFLNLTNPTGVIIADGQATGTIQNDDGTPIQVSINDVSIVEGQSGTSILTFTVTRTGGTGAFDVGFSTADGTATAGSDYVANSGIVSFGAGQNTATVSVTINGDLTQEQTENFFVNLSSPTNDAVIIDAQGIGTITNDEPTYIHDIQGTAYFSPLLAAEGINSFNVASIAAVTVRAVVTAVDNVGARQGYYLSEEITDWDGNSYTSEGIFVMTRNDANVGNVVSGVAVGDLVQLSAHVMEYQSFSTMPRTVLVNPTDFSVVSQGNPLPTMTLTNMPNAVMTVANPDYFDSSDGVGDTFDASVYALSYFETVEGMLVTIPNMVVADGFVSTSGGDPYLQAYSLDSANPEQINSRGGYTVAGDPPLAPPNTPSPLDDTVNGGQVLHDGDVNPDVIELDFTDFATSAPAGLLTGASMGDLLGDVTGIIDFDFTDRKLFVTAMEPGGFVDGTQTQEVTAFGSDSRSLTVATFNVENLDPTDGAARFTALANAIKNNLHSPDIISIEEMQDNNGAAAGDGTSGTGTDASQTWQMLVDALNLATGAHYQWVDQAPVYNAEGGEQSGNIRVGFLYNTDRVQLGNLDANATLAERRQYTDRIGDGVRDAGDLIAYSDNMLGGEINTTDWTTTRKSLLGEFTFNGNTVYVTANHWPSKGGSGEFWQLDQSGGDPNNSDWAQRNAVAQDVYSMLNLIEQNAPGVGIVAGGDFNDFYFYRPLTTVTGYTNADGTARVGGARFDNLTLTLAEAERYSYTFDGRSQAIDHIIVNNLLAGVADYDVVHINTGFNPTNTPALSDHDPAVASFDYRSFSEVLNGTAGNDLILGYGGDDRLLGGNGNDTLDGGVGVDIADGGAGDDTYFVDNAGDQVIEAVGGGNDLVASTTSYALSAGAEVEILSTVNGGGTAAIALTGNAFGQAITGNAGANFLYGGGGADTLDGGAGDDVIIVDTDDQVVEAAGGGNDLVATLSSYALNAGAEVETLSTTYSGGNLAIALTGNAFGQTIIGNAGNNFLNGAGGTDTLQGLAGNDTYIVDSAGDQVLEAVGGGDDLVATLSSYALNAGAEVETLSTTYAGGNLAIALTGNEFGQTIIGNAGDNFLNGGGGADILQGLGGSDVYIVDADDLVLEGAGGGNDLVASTTSYALNAGAEVETLSTVNSGNNAALNLTGNAFGQTIIGNAGANILDGGLGADSLQGLGGADTFAFTTALGGGNVDAILDFAAGSDKIALDDAVFTGLGLGALNANAFVIGTAAGDADDRIIYNSATGQLFFDADGNGAGAAVLFATLGVGLNLTASDFQVI
jgi:predicted extracellular nuclease